jgi:hypothetical protein
MTSPKRARFLRILVGILPRFVFPVTILSPFRHVSSNPHSFRRIPDMVEQTILHPITAKQYSLRVISVQISRPRISMSPEPLSGGGIVTVPRQSAAAVSLPLSRINSSPG